MQITLVSDGQFKGLTEPGVPVGDKAIAETQRTVSAVANLFRAAVGRGRNLQPGVVSQLADGRVHVASEALALGLIDEIGTLDAALNLGGKMSTSIANTTRKIKAAADGADGASGGEGSTPDMAEMCGKILDAVNALADYVKQAMPVEDDSKDDEKSDQASADDASAKALVADRTRLTAIMAACPGREKFATEQFLAGKTAVEAQAALAGVLANENAALAKKLAAGEDGADPIAGVQPQGGGNDANADPEQIWTKNVGGVQKMFNGKKDYFLKAVKHTPQFVKDLIAKNRAA